MTATNHDGVAIARPARFWDRIAARYARKPVPDEAAYRKKLQITRRYLTPESEVLEFGCGTGSTAIAHAPYAKRIRASDISSRMIEIARNKARDAGVSNVTFEQSAFEDLAVDDGTCDVVMGHSILHLLADRDAAIARVHRMLKAGGVFVSNTACIGDVMPWFRLIAPLGRALGLLPFVTVFTTEELTASLADAGFAIDYEWTLGRGKAVFIVAKKAA